VGTATAIRIAAVVTFGLLGALGTRVLRSLARGWSLLAIGFVPAAIGVVAATWALSRLPSGVPVSTGDSVAWQMVLQAACVPAMAGLGASACAMMVVHLESALAYWALIGPARVSAGGWSRGSVGRGIATGCAHAVLLLAFLPLMAPSGGGLLSAATAASRGWALLTALAIVTASVSAIAQAVSSPWLAYLQDPEAQTAAWNRAAIVPVGAALAVLFLECAGGLGSLRPFKIAPFAIGVGDSNDLTLFVLPAAVFAAGAWPLWRFRRQGPRRRLLAVIIVAVLCAAAVPVVLEGRIEKAEAKLDPVLAPSFPCVVSLRGMRTIKERRNHPEVAVTLDLSNTLDDDLDIEGAEYGGWTVSSPGVVPAHGSAQVQLRRELNGGDTTRPISACIRVRWSDMPGRLCMPPTKPDLDPSLRRSLEDGTVEWHSIFDP
jgi:hypothetical protein